MTLAIIVMCAVLLTWVAAVTTEIGRVIIAWLTYFLGVFTLSVIVLGSILLSANFLLREMGA